MTATMYGDAGTALIPRGEHPLLPDRGQGGIEEQIEPAILRFEIIERDNQRRARLRATPATYHGAPVIMREDWRSRAACRDMDMRLFFAVGRPKARVVKACASCPVREACLTEAMIEDADYKEPFGYRGGMEPIGRQRVRHGVNPGRIGEKSIEIRARFMAECGGSETDSELLHRLAGEYGLRPADLKRAVRNVA